jgi:DNA phosphorothioation-dependent restriction protein DptH
MAKCAEAHEEKAQQQLENGLRHLIEVFRPRHDAQGSEDDRPDQRYWWLQLHRLIASKAQIAPRDQSRMLAALERLVEGDYSIEWRAAAVTYWTDQKTAELKMVEEWQYSTYGHELGIAVVSAGSECVRAVCATPERFNLPWSASYIRFDPAISMAQPGPATDNGGEGEDDGARGVEPESSGKHSRDRGAVPERPIEAKPIEVRPVVVREVPRRIFLGKSVQGSRPIYWEFGHEGLNNRHMLIFGASGEGKTYAIQCLLCELAASGQNSLIVDYTNGFLPNQLEAQTLETLKPLQHVIRQAPLPINPFRGQTADLGGIIIPESHSAAAKRIAAIFQVVYDLGEQQFSVLFDAIVEGLRHYGDKMSLDSLMEILAQFAKDDSKNKNATQTVSSKIKPFVLDKPFDFGREGLDWQALFTDAVNRCHVFQLAGLDMHSWRLVTEFVLWDLYGYLQAKGRKNDPKVIVLDEVQNLDHRDGSPLSRYLREGRKFGLSLIMATQIMSSLEKDERDRMFNAGHKLFFRPADTEMRAYADIAAISTAEKPEIWVKRLAGLKKGECYSLGPSLNEATGKLEAKAFHIKITSLEDRGTHA